jgi:hypothetical protein
VARTLVGDFFKGGARVANDAISGSGSGSGGMYFDRRAEGVLLGDDPAVEDPPAAAAEDALHQLEPQSKSKSKSKSKPKSK